MSSAVSRFEAIVRQVLPRDPSDLFLIPGEPPAVRVPPHFLVERLDTEPLTPEDIDEVAGHVFGEKTLAMLGEGRSRLRRRYAVPGEFCLTLNAARSLGTTTITCRFMQPRVPGVEEVSLPDAMVRTADLPNGLVLFSGPMGSGKTTSMLALLDHINKTKAVHICTVEDPISVLLTPQVALVQQREVGEDVPGVLAGIQASLSQDLDVLMVGDLRGVDELEGCFAAAETGHLVLTQVHAETPAGAIRRVLEVYPEELRDRACHMLARHLKAVSCQRLVRRADGKGRVAVYGVLIPDDELRHALAHGADFMARRGPWPEGCQTIDQGLADLVARRVVAGDTAQAMRESLVAD